MPPDATATNEYLLGVMNQKLDQLLARSAEDRITIDKLTARVSKLEAWRWMQVGAAGVAGSALSAIAGAVLR